MSNILKSLKLTEMPAQSRDPIANAKVGLISKLEDQKRLLEDPTYTRKWQRYTGKGADRKLVTVEQRVRSWVKPTPTGVAFCIYLGQSPMFFAKDRPAIALQSRDEVPELIDRLVEAVKSGEMDDVIKSTLASRKPRDKAVGTPKAVKKAA